MLLACLVIWLAWVVQAVQSARLARHLARKIAAPPPAKEVAHRPPATVMIPITGEEDDAFEVVKALQSQRYPHLRALFLVETAEDPAYAATRRALEAYPDLGAEVVVTGKAPRWRSQKVHKSLTALERLDADAREGDVWAFADADAIPDANWLGNLVGPLRRSDCVVTTGYRWLVPCPRPGRRRPSPWSVLAAVLNNSVGTLQAHKPTVQAWGGSMALTAGTARRGGLLELWRRSLADDYTMTQLAAKLGRPVRFAPRCLVPSPVTYGLSQLAEFTRRQYVITRVYAPRIYGLALLFTSLYVLGTVTSWAYLARHLVVPTETEWQWLWPVPFMVAVFVANQVRAAARRRCVTMAFSPDTVRRLRGVLWMDRWCTPLWMAIHAGLVLSALVGRTIRWRGAVYVLHGPQRVERLDAGIET